VGGGHHAGSPIHGTDTPLQRPHQRLDPERPWPEPALAGGADRLRSRQLEVLGGPLVSSPADETRSCRDRARPPSGSGGGTTGPFMELPGDVPPAEYEELYYRQRDTIEVA